MTNKFSFVPELFASSPSIVNVHTSDRRGGSGKEPVKDKKYLVVLGNSTDKTYVHVFVQTPMLTITYLRRALLKKLLSTYPQTLFYVVYDGHYTGIPPHKKLIMRPYRDVLTTGERFGWCKNVHVQWSENATDNYNSLLRCFDDNPVTILKACKYL